MERTGTQGSQTASQRFTQPRNCYGKRRQADWQVAGRDRLRFRRFPRNLLRAQPAQRNCIAQQHGGTAQRNCTVQPLKLHLQSWTCSEIPSGAECESPPLGTGGLPQDGKKATRPVGSVAFSSYQWPVTGLPNDFWRTADSMVADSLKSNLRQGWEPALGAIPRYAEEVRLICLGIAAAYKTVNCLGNKQCSGQTRVACESIACGEAPVGLLPNPEVSALPIFAFP